MSGVQSEGTGTLVRDRLRDDLERELAGEAYGPGSEADRNTFIAMPPSAGATPVNTFISVPPASRS